MCVCLDHYITQQPGATFHGLTHAYVPELIKSLSIFNAGITNIELMYSLNVCVCISGVNTRIRIKKRMYLELPRELWEL